MGCRANFDLWHQKIYQDASTPHRCLFVGRSFPVFVRPSFVAIGGIILLSQSVSIKSPNIFTFGLFEYNQSVATLIYEFNELSPCTEN